MAALWQWNRATRLANVVRRLSALVTGQHTITDLHAQVDDCQTSLFLTTRESAQKHREEKGLIAALCSRAKDLITGKTALRDEISALKGTFRSRDRDIEFLRKGLDTEKSRHEDEMRRQKLDTDLQVANGKAPLIKLQREEAWKMERQRKKYEWMKEQCERLQVSPETLFLAARCLIHANRARGTSTGIGLRC